jgi:hypothetical protein
VSEAAGDARRTGPALEAMYQFLLWLIPTVDKFPRSQKFVLGDRMETAALDVLDAPSYGEPVMHADEAFGEHDLVADQEHPLASLPAVGRLSHEGSEVPKA